MTTLFIISVVYLILSYLGEISGIQEKISIKIKEHSIPLFRVYLITRLVIATAAFGILTASLFLKI